MDQMPATPFTSQNVAGVAAPIGNVPNDRIFQSPAPGNATEADLICFCEKEKRLCELIDGTLVEKAMGAIESYLALVLSPYLGNYITDRFVN